jgi:uncharacterized protein (DUF488 family)
VTGSVLTVGHGTLPAEDFAALLTGAGVELVVDVRSHPGSRRHPHFGSEVMAAWLPAAGVDYAWEPRLGGRRRRTAGSAHVALDNPAFQAYADHMGTPEFAAGVDALVELAGEKHVTVMCAESLWWRCHRRLLADSLALLREIEVVHLFHDDRREAHRPTDAVRVEAGALVYDVGSTATLL